MFKKSYFLVLPFFFLSLGACTSGYSQNAKTSQEKELTVGVVQKEIHQGMSQADVAQALGSPNIVTKDSQSKETWIYDKIASEVQNQSKNNEISWIVFLVGGNHTKSSSSSVSTQKTLTVIIKFDKNSNVETFSYHSSKF